MTRLRKAGVAALIACSALLAACSGSGGKGVGFDSSGALNAAKPNLHFSCDGIESPSK